MLAKNYAQILEFLILKCSFGPERLPGLWRNRPLDHYRQINFGVIDPVTVAQYIPSRSDRQDVKIYHTKELSGLHHWPLTSAHTMGYSFRLAPETKVPSCELPTRTCIFVKKASHRDQTGGNWGCYGYYPPRLAHRVIYLSLQTPSTKLVY